jgi:alpha-ketoglutarate-dependent taurine dioxygenase
VTTASVGESIDERASWTRHEMEADRSWIYEIAEPVKAELRDSLEWAKRASVGEVEIDPRSFPLAAATPVVRSILHQLEYGRGVALLRGLPIERLADRDCRLLFAGLTSHLGISIVQDTAGTLLEEVCDKGLSYDSIAVRGYMTRAHLTPHCDSGDVVALLCVRPARSGGANVVSSSISVYNEIRATEPWRLEPLHRGFFYNIRGNGPPGDYRDITGHRVPVFCWHAGRLSCRFNEKAIVTAEQLPNVPPLTDLERSTIELVATLASDPRFTIELLLEPGDLLLLCNHSVLHNRTSFDDGARGRLFLRKWINLEEGRDLPWNFGDHYNTGIRQGPYVDSDVS